MIGFFKTRQGNILIGDYTSAPSENTYNSLSEIPNNSYGILTAEQTTRYNEIFNFNKSAELNNKNPANEKIALKQYDLKYIFEGVVTPAPEPSLDDLKQSKLNTLKSNYETKLGLGYLTSSIEIVTQIATEELPEETDTISFAMRCDDIARAKFTQMKSHLQGIETGIYPIWDKNGLKYMLKVNVYKSLLIAYGDYLIGQEEIYNDKQILIAIAESEEDLETINIDF